MNLGYIGLGKMGYGMVSRLLEKGYGIVAFDTTAEAVKKISSEGARGVGSVAEMVSLLPAPRVVWVMTPHQAVDGVLTEIIPLLKAGDTIIEGGNSPYKESMRRAKEIETKGVGFLDAGISGGPGGARNGACAMVGGRKELFNRHEKLFRDISVENGYGYMGKSGAGHFVKMVHNGIEYGMMQAIAEGFEVMKKSDFALNLRAVADLYNNGSVVESRLVGWLKDGFEKYGENLGEISGRVSHSGEGLWTVEVAKELGAPVPIIEGALKFRVDSRQNPSYSGKVLSVMRNMFGGHEVKK
ncbi:MAG: 6-phosphogluconate dehydrogenase (decarboxylating) [Candidatus Terrybacteria bacterium RIFCSPLOWO2_02_42_20]|uniref:6-phosphogluconate dehydrogenase (Decarboxylating) n=2 Tax=Candidatus Terryibacteriota TaxID=1817920 RepID=A0A1G2PKD2_9BACT|nr:MAG: 6-phosphogluconate dehydrogenase (decarboxylating) [Candidatus Terrybacteria bacterium RIFCSPHIGHO2_02_41_19]OHA53892.1 MAG: 6-phosphogluconate dehydrogenase (decarboxylating) [Candidatus Terrybacteria bacterium RIFCSPLOWO2_02_42_20]